MFFLLILVSCNSEERYSTTDMWRMATKVEPGIELLPITQEDRRILCKNYGDGCIPMSGRRLGLRMVELIAVEYETEAYAKEAALQIDQFYAKNCNDFIMSADGQ